MSAARPPSLGLPPSAPFAPPQPLYATAVSAAAPSPQSLRNLIIWKTAAERKKGMVAVVECGRVADGCGSVYVRETRREEREGESEKQREKDRRKRREKEKELTEIRRARRRV